MRLRRRITSGGCTARSWSGTAYCGAAVPEDIEAEAVVTIAAPSDPARVAGLFNERAADNRERAEVEGRFGSRDSRFAFGASFRNT
jgi:hypothetical protein